VSELPTTRARKRRADATRSSTAVLDAAIVLLGRQPQASMEQIAAAAGVARQTVYAHYASREALLGAIAARLTIEVAAALNAVDLDTGSAAACLSRWLEASWHLLERYPVLLHGELAASAAPDDYESHLPITERLSKLLRRGQQNGEFDTTLPTAWHVAAIISLGHTAAQEVTAGRMNADDAGAAFRRSVLRVCARTPRDVGQPRGVARADR
jgi:AcrR family transcriptional regulator